MANIKGLPLYTGSSDGDYELALARVDRARQARSKSLSLNSLSDLDRLPPLVGLSELRSLNLHGTRVADLRGIGGAHNLRDVWLSRNTSDLDPMVDLPKLSRLSVHSPRSRGRRRSLGFKHLTFGTLPPLHSSDLAKKSGQLEVNLGRKPKPRSRVVSDAALRRAWRRQ